MRTTILLLIILLGLGLTSCKEEAQIWEPDSDELVIADFVSGNTELYSQFAELIQLTGMKSLLKIRGPYTFFLPTDEAMFTYYELKGVSSLPELDEALLNDLILTHIVPAFIGTNDIGLGALREPNALGDYLPTEFVGSDILVSKYSKIIDRDVPAANGIIHILDRVLDPVKDDIFSVVQSDPSYSIFAEGLDITGLSDTLRIISFPYGTKTARTRFTVLGVADSIYNRYGISSVSDLIEWTGGHPDSSTILEDEFYRYMEYHCLNGSYYLSDFVSGVYPILSRDNNVSFRIDTDYKINYDRTTEEYTGFNVPASNIPAKNGAFHSIDDLLPAIEPEPATVRFLTTDFFDLSQGDYYRKYYKRFFDGENTFLKIKWRGDYLLYYYKEQGGATVYNDCLSMQGWWELSVTFPKVMKGVYDVSIFQPPWGDITDCAVYIDGEKAPVIYAGPFGTGSGGLQRIATGVVFDKTEEHTITLRNVSAGMVFWDYVEFVPSN